MQDFQRPIVAVLRSRLEEPRRTMQAVLGPRQSGKTTAVLQALAQIGMPSRFGSADVPGMKQQGWIEAEWEEARNLLPTSPGGSAVLVLDEVQKITQWSEVVKKCWDEDTRLRRPLHVVLLGSSTVLIRAGLSESLVGRFEVIRAPHWSFREMSEAFGWDLDRYIFHGGYPGAAPLVHDETRWLAYIRESILEPTISRDALLLQRVDKPILLRHLMDLACTHSGQVLSYTKMVGQLQDAGNTTTLAHYLELLSSIGIVSGLSKYARGATHRRASSPKLQVWNNALLSAHSGLRFEEARRNPAVWGRLVESAVGAHILNSTMGTWTTTHYWSDRSAELDFVIAKGSETLGIEVKSSSKPADYRSLEQFKRAHPGASTRIIGPAGMSLDQALATDVDSWCGKESKS